ncbi:MAG: trigger factor, partial [Desulfobacterales bacterium]|nr:trigger factor [Desulfobacterales bacterium]
MQVTVEDLSSVKKKLQIRIPESDVNRELNDAYRELKQSAKIKGFRPGKVPRSILAQRFGKDVNANVSSKLIQSSLEEAVKEKKLAVLGAPEMKPFEFKGKGPIECEIVVEVKPELDEIDFKGLKLKKNIYNPSDEEVDLQLKMLQKNLSSQTPIEEDRPVKEGDHVLLDYEGFKDGEPFEELQKTENTVLKIGAGAILAELDEGLIGMAKGESKEIPVKFP